MKRTEQIKNDHFRLIFFLNNKDQNFNELQLHLVRFLTFSMRINIQARKRKTEINSLKTTLKNIDGSLKCFCEGSGKIHFQYIQKDFFSSDNRIDLL